MTPLYESAPPPKIGEPRPLGEYILPVVSTRFVILHYHIFKNAGSTVEYALRRSFGRAFATLHGPEAGSILNGPEVTQFLQEHPEVAVVSSHHLKYPKPVAPNLVVFDCCVLRDPLERLWSMYQHFRRAEPTDDLCAKARRMDTRTFFHHLLEEHAHLVNNVQVNILANGAAYTRPPDSTDLKAALRVTREIAALGVVHLLDESLVAAEYFLRPAFPGISLDYVSQNVSPPGEPVSRFRKAVGHSIYQQLRRMNDHDAALVAWAAGEIRRRFELVPDCKAKLAAFRRRCALLDRRQSSALPVSANAGVTARPLA